MQDVRDPLHDLAKAAQRLQKRHAHLSASETQRASKRARGFSLPRNTSPERTLI